MKKTNNSRRDFVKNTSVLGLGIISTPKTFFINKGIDSDDQIIGHGDFRYKIDKKWGVNAQYPVNDCHEMVLDKNKNLYLTTNHNSNNILKFGFLENFFSSISSISRAMIFNSTAIFYGYYRLIELNNFKINKKKFIKYFSFVCILFLISLLIVSKIRQTNNFPIG